MRAMIDLSLLKETPVDKRIILKKNVTLDEKEIKSAIHSRLLKAEKPGAIVQAAAAIEQGGLVVFPTDTVYGIGADAFNEQAIFSLYQVKHRPLDKGIPILLADLADLSKVAAFIPETAEQLIARFWPGPLTLIVPKHQDLPEAISTTPSVAVRMPDNDIARSVIRAAGGSVATSSANKSGNEPALLAATAWDYFSGQVAVVLDGGPSGGNIASTIIDCTGQNIRILREGPIKPSELKAIISKSV